MAAADYVRIPPGLRNVLVPVRPAAAAALGTTLYTASRPRALGAQRLLWVAARAGAMRVMPGDRERWQPPMGDEVLAALLEQWRETTGVPITGLAIYNRPQENRAGFALMVCAGRNSLLVRVRREATSLALERRISELAQSLHIDAFRVPKLLAADSIAGWNWVGYEVIGRRPHAPAREAGDDVVDQACALVEAAVVRPDGIPKGWRGAHGDLTPWNLRRMNGVRWLIDWEDARYAPEGADATYFAVTRAAMRKRVSSRELPDFARYAEAREYWSADLRSRSSDKKDDQLIAHMLSLLAQGARASDAS